MCAGRWTRHLHVLHVHIHRYILYYVNVHVDCSRCRSACTCMRAHAQWMSRRVSGMYYKWVALWRCPKALLDTHLTNTAPRSAASTWKFDSNVLCDVLYRAHAVGHCGVIAACHFLCVASDNLYVFCLFHSNSKLAKECLCFNAEFINETHMRRDYKRLI